MALWMIWVIAALAAVAIHFYRIYSTFAARGIKTPLSIPPLGSMTMVVLKKENVIDNINRNYFNFPTERFVGRYEFTKPLLILRDVELIKKITVKDFDHFMDHKAFPSGDTLFGRNLFFLKGQEWKDMRSTLSPAFTSSKMRLMVPFMIDVGNQMLSNLKQTIKESGTGYIEMDVKDLTTRYTCDVIASCAFGLKVDSHSERENEFYTQGLDTTTIKFSTMLIFLLSSAIPFVGKILRMNSKLSSQKDGPNYFQEIVNSTMSEREKMKIIRNDMIHLLMEAKKGKLTHDEHTQETDTGFSTAEESEMGKQNVTRNWTQNDLVAQALLFFFAGFETVSSGMSFLLYELAVHPEAQEKVFAEIKELDAKNGGKLDFNSIQQLTYLDQALSETLRLWPPVRSLDRMCIKDYNLGKPNPKGQDYIMRKGEGLHIPVGAIHRDPEFFPNPTKFDPDRFSEENKHKIKPFTYAPFGLGPRNCIGSRFALCEIKVMAYQLLLQYEVLPCAKTTIPPRLDTNTFQMKLDGGHWLRLKPRV